MPGSKYHFPRVLHNFYFYFFTSLGWAPKGYLLRLGSLGLSAHIIRTKCCIYVVVCSVHIRVGKCLFKKGIQVYFFFKICNFIVYSIKTNLNHASIAGVW